MRGRKGEGKRRETFGLETKQKRNRKKKNEIPKQNKTKRKSATDLPAVPVEVQTGNALPVEQHAPLLRAVHALEQLQDGALAAAAAADERDRPARRDRQRESVEHWPRDAPASAAAARGRRRCFRCRLPRGVGVPEGDVAELDRALDGREDEAPARGRGVAVVIVEVLKRVFFCVRGGARLSFWGLRVLPSPVAAKRKKKNQEPKTMPPSSQVDHAQQPPRGGPPQRQSLPRGDGLRESEAGGHRGKQGVDDVASRPLPRRHGDAAAVPEGEGVAVGLLMVGLGERAIEEGG